MNLRQLEIFTCVVNTGSFTKAAKLLHMAQPAVSIAIRKLEDELNIQLVSRTDTIRATAEGNILLEHAQKLLSGMQLAKQAMSDLTQLNQGVVRFSTTPILGEYFFPDKIKAFAGQYPNIDFQVIDQDTINDLSALENQHCDISVVNMENLPKGIEAIHLKQQEIVACLAKDHPLANKKKIKIENFLQQPLALYGKQHILRHIVDEASSRLGISIHTALETDLAGMQLKTIAQSQCVGLSLGKMVKDDAVRLLPFHTPLFLKLGLGWKKDKYLSSANRAFIQFLKND